MSEQVQSAPVQETPSQDSSIESTESQETNQEQVTAPTEPTLAEKKEQQRLLKKYNLKVDGRDEDMEVDLSNDDEVKKHLQMSRAAQKRMQEAADLRKSAEQFIDMLKTNPRKVLQDPNINVDLKKLVQEYLDEEVANSAKTPEQLALEKAQKELQEIKDKYKKDEEDRKSKEMARLQAEHEEKIQTNIETALNSGQLPKTPYTVRKMAELMIMALDNKIDLEPKDLVPLLRKQMNNDIKELFSSSSDDILEELLGKDNISRIRKRTIAKVKQASVPQTAAAVKQTGTENSKKQDEKAISKQTIRDWLKV